jgi:hypothetical protein
MKKQMPPSAFLTINFTLQLVVANIIPATINFTLQLVANISFHLPQLLATINITLPLVATINFKVVTSTFPLPLVANNIRLFLSNAV